MTVVGNLLLGTSVGRALARRLAWPGRWPAHNQPSGPVTSGSTGRTTKARGNNIRFAADCVECDADAARRSDRRLDALTAVSNTGANGWSDRLCKLPIPTPLAGQPQRFAAAHGPPPPLATATGMADTLGAQSGAGPAQPPATPSIAVTAGRVQRRAYARAIQRLCGAGFFHGRQAQQLLAQSLLPARAASSAPAPSLGGNSRWVCGRVEAVGSGVPLLPGLAVDLSWSVSRLKDEIWRRLSFSKSSSAGASAGSTANNATADAGPRHDTCGERSEEYEAGEDEEEEEEEEEETPSWVVRLFRDHGGPELLDGMTCAGLPPAAAAAAANVPAAAASPEQTAGGHGRGSGGAAAATAAAAAATPLEEGFVLTLLRFEWQPFGAGAVLPPAVEMPVACYAVRWSPGGTRAAAAGSGGFVQVWSCTSPDTAAPLRGKQLLRTTAHCQVSHLEWCRGRRPGGAQPLAFVTVDTGWTIRLWEEAAPRLHGGGSGGGTGGSGDDGDRDGDNDTDSDGDDEASWVCRRQVVASAVVRAMDCSPDGTHVAVGLGGDCRVRVWDLRTGVVARVVGHTAQGLPVGAIRYSPDGARLAVAGGDERVHLWATSNWACEATLAGHQCAVVSLCWHPDSVHLASGARDSNVRVWDTRTAVRGGYCRCTLRGTGDTPTALSWHPTGAHLAVGTDSGVVLVWDTRRGGRKLTTFPAHPSSPVHSVQWHPDGLRMLTAATVATWSEDQLKVWHP